MCENKSFSTLYSKIIDKVFKLSDSISFFYDTVSVNFLSLNNRTVNFINEYFKHYFYVINSNEILSPSVVAIEDTDVYIKFLNIDLSLKNRRFEVIKFSTNIICILDYIKSVVLVISPENNKCIIKFIIRIIRDLISLLLNKNGFEFFHCACATKNNEAIGIIGNTFSGKTTTLINLILKNHFCFLSNDKVAIKFKLVNKKLSAIGIPTSVGVRQSDLFEDIFSKCTNLKTKEEKIFLSPNLFTEILETTINPFAEIKFFVVPKYDKFASELKLSQMTEKQIERFLRTQTVSPHYEEQSFLVKFIKDHNKNRSKNLIKEVSKSIPFYKLVQNRYHMEQVIKLMDKML